MRIAITGSKGQLGTALQRVLTQDVLLGVDLPELDLSNIGATLKSLGEFAPEVIIHCAAMTDVDGCERNPEMAYRVNTLATRNVAVAAEQCGASMVYIGTDYVFDGHKQSPYWEYDAPNPLSVYGQSKFAGEQLVRSLVRRYYITRTTGLYMPGFRNFVGTVMRLAGERGSLSMATDEVISPTYAIDLAQALDRLIRVPAYGIYHLVNEGACTRYEWAQEILRLAKLEHVSLTGIENYQRPAPVPKHAIMRNFCAKELGIVLRPWQEALKDYFA